MHWRCNLSILFIMFTERAEVGMDNSKEHDLDTVAETSTPENSMKAVEYYCYGGGCEGLKVISCPPLSSANVLSSQLSSTFKRNLQSVLWIYFCNMLRSQGSAEVLGLLDCCIQRAFNIPGLIILCRLQICQFLHHRKKRCWLRWRLPVSMLLIARSSRAQWSLFCPTGFLIHQVLGHSKLDG